MSDRDTSYRVLARKYRPQTFAELIGQDALVRTLTNAIAQDRLAHAFILTGVRGVGKTTTARILARGLNCIGQDGNGGVTAQPCGVCEHCRAIAEDRHVDVIEMDAASRTGVGDIRELIEGVRYRPVSARYKVYIIDEVHMLSTAAFNALLKTLEEPPPHTKFVFATTEIRKVPVTVLSRCQRFDLRRIEIGALAAHLRLVAEREGLKLAPDVALMLARAGEGSARDALSLLDQAIAIGGAAPDADSVRSMLGLSDRSLLFDLVTHGFAGRIAEALGLLRQLYEAGGDPAALLQDLLDLVHFLTRIKLVPEAAADETIPQAERERAAGLAADISVPVLARAWSLLLRGAQEVAQASDPIAAAEMVLVRLAYMAEVPSPAELIRNIGQSGPKPAAPRIAAPPMVPARALPPRAPIIAPNFATNPAPAAPAASPPAAAAAGAAPATFTEMVAMFSVRREPLLFSHLTNHAHLVRYAPGEIRFRLEPAAPRDLVAKMVKLLQGWTGLAWNVETTSEPGEPTLAEQRAEREAARKQAVTEHPFVQAALAAFPGAELAEVREQTNGGSKPGGQS
jgi:DNA polymerase III subunit gamma/tau